MLLVRIYGFDLYPQMTGQLEEFHRSGLLCASQYIVKDSQPSKALSPIEVTLSGMKMLVSDLQWKNA